MADNATEPKPLTEAEERQLEALQARKQQIADEQTKAQAAEAEMIRKEAAARMAPIEALIKKLDASTVVTTIDGLVADPAVDFESKKLLESIRNSMVYTVQALQSRVDSYKVAPVVTPTA